MASRRHFARLAPAVLRLARRLLRHRQVGDVHALGDLACPAEVLASADPNSRGLPDSPCHA
eukprot:6203545-Pleurochrysis_carterae.AAC.1